MKTIFSMAFLSLALCSVPAFASDSAESDHAGPPISLSVDLNGVSASFTTDDGTTIHTSLKAHRAFLGLPEGVEVAFSVSVGQSPVLDFSRIYGIFELGTISSDIQAAFDDIQSQEWRETSLTLVKMLLCAQLAKLPETKNVPSFLVTWANTALKPVCSE